MLQRALVGIEDELAEVIRTKDQALGQHEAELRAERDSLQGALEGATQDAEAHRRARETSQEALRGAESAVERERGLRLGLKRDLDREVAEGSELRERLVLLAESGQQQHRAADAASGLLVEGGDELASSLSGGGGCSPERPRAALGTLTQEPPASSLMARPKQPSLIRTTCPSSSPAKVSTINPTHLNDLRLTCDALA